jgi:hypothetical protein
VPHISLVFREMWDTTALQQQLCSVKGQKVTFEVSRISPKTSEIPRISCHATLDKTACAPFSQGKAHEVHGTNEASQEIGFWGTRRL